MTTLAQLNVLFSTDTRGLTAGLSEAGKKTKTFAKSAAQQAQRVGGEFRKVTDRVFNLKSAIGVLAGSAGIGLLVSNNLKSIDALAKFSDSIGESTENVQAFRRQADLAGVEQSTMDKALSRSARVAAEAARGVGEAAEEYRRLGLSAQEVVRLSPVDAFWAQAEAISQLTTRSEQLKAANSLFGRGAVDVIRIIDSGKGSFEGIRAEMERTGEAISRIDAARVEAANDAITRMKGSASVLGQELTIRLAPYIEAVADLLRESMYNGDQMFEAMRTGGNIAIKIIGALADGVHALKVVFQGLRTLAVGFGSAFLSTIELAANAFVVFADTVNGSVNDILRGLNRIPGVEIELIQSFNNAGWVQSIRTLGDQSRNAVADERQKLHDELMKPLPSEAIQQFVEGVAKRAEEFQPKLRAPTIGGDIGSDPASAASQQEAFAARLERLRAHLYTEEEAERVSHQLRMIDLDELRQQGFIQDQIYNELKEQLEQSHQDKLNDIAKKGMTARQQFDAMEWKAKTQMTLGSMAQITAGAAQQNKALFRVNKAASLATAIASLPSAVIQSYNNAGGYPWGIVPAAAMAAVGLSQINKIRSASFGGGGSASAPSAPSVAGSAPSTAVTPISDQQSPQQAPQQAPRSLTLVMPEKGMMPVGSVRELMAKIAEEFGDNVNFRTA